jgi:Putative bacterial sensory transduction regulator
MTALQKTLVACVAVLLLPAVGPAQEVFKEISGQRLESILTGMGFTYKKGDAGKGTFYYDFKSKNLTLRLTSYDGRDLMLDIYLPPIDWKEVNRWNRTMKFSRASLGKDAGGLDSVVLESNLDLRGGVTEETIKHFIRNFDVEITSFANFSAPVAAKEEVYKNISAARLEKILDGMNLKYKKSSAKGGDFYDFTKKINDVNYGIRLTNFNGQDLMIDCIFKEYPVAKLNAWNVKRSYVRAVLYPGGGKPWTALESNLDCVAGTNDSIVRYFINTFDEEVRAFDKYLMGN